MKKNLVRPHIKSLILSFIFAILAFLMTGCRNADPCPRIDGIVNFAPIKIHRASTYIAGTSVTGTPIECTTFGYGTDVVLFIASIHGTERAGTPLMKELIDYLEDHPEVLTGKKIIILPKINPDGFAMRQRHNANDIDLNRNFPADNRVNNTTNGNRGLTEPESRIIHRLMHLYDPDRIITFHEALNCVDYDGPAESLALKMAAECDIPFKKVGARPGSLGSYAGETLGIPIITVEFSDKVRSMNGKQLWKEYKDMVLVAIEG